MPLAICSRRAKIDQRWEDTGKYAYKLYDKAKVISRKSGRAA